MLECESGFLDDIAPQDDCDGALIVDLLSNGNCGNPGSAPPLIPTGGLPHQIDRPGCFPTPPVLC